MTSEGTGRRARGPALLCYDGSEPAKAAIERAAVVLGGGPALVLTAWESLGSIVLRYPNPGRTQLGREIREISGEVVDELDADTAEQAHATAAEGVEIANAAGFEARPLARRAIGRLSERTDVTVWHAILRAADDEDAAVLVLGSRGRSGLTSAVLGSVSYGVLHASKRPVLIVPPAE